MHHDDIQVLLRTFMCYLKSSASNKLSVLKKALWVIGGFSCVSLCQHKLEPQIQAVSWLLEHMSHTNVVCHVGMIAVCLYLWSVTSCFRQGHFKNTLLTVWNDKASASVGVWDHNKYRVLSRSLSSLPLHLTLPDSLPPITLLRGRCYVYRTAYLQISELKAI